MKHKITVIVANNSVGVMHWNNSLPNTIVGFNKVLRVDHVDPGDENKHKNGRNNTHLCDYLGSYLIHS